MSSWIHKPRIITFLWRGLCVLGVFLDKRMSGVTTSTLSGFYLLFKCKNLMYLFTQDDYAPGKLPFRLVTAEMLSAQPF